MVLSHIISEINTDIGRKT